MLTTLIWNHTPTGKRFLQGTIKAGTRFLTIPNAKDGVLETPEGQKQKADEQIEMWKRNGPYPVGTRWVVEQTRGGQHV